MKNKLWVRLSVGFLLLMWVVLGVVALSVRESVQSSFRSYVSTRDATLFDDDLVYELQAHYAETQSWQGVGTLLLGRRGSGNDPRGGGGIQFFVADAVADTTSRIVAATDAIWIGETIEAIGLTRTTPLKVDGVVVGYLGQQTPGEMALHLAETQFLTETLRRLLLTAGLGGVVAVAAGVALSWSLMRPLNTLTGGVHALASGALGEQIPVKGTMEMRALAQAFNTMSQRLAETERARQRMSSDVAHELRTPMSVLRGHLEAMMDGVYPMDGEHLGVAYNQTLHLARLIEDLQLLTRAEAGRLPLDRTRVSPETLVEQAEARFALLAQDARLTLTAQVAPGLPELYVDVGRIQQVFDNLLSNALRHTTPQGEIILRAERAPDAVRFSVYNSGTLDPEQAKHVFDRFWRADDARQRDAGGSGLGLAITRQLVLLHGGRVFIEPNDAQTRFIVDLPV